MSIADDITALDVVDLATVLQRTLEDLQQIWLIHQRDLLAPTTTVSARYQQLQGELVILNNLDAGWQATLDSTQAQGELTDPLREIIDNQQAAIAATRGRLRPRIDAVLEIQTRLATLNNEVTEALDLIAVLRAEVRQRLFSRDAEPFWRTQRDVDVLLQQGRDAWEQRINTVRNWVLTDFDRIVLHALVFAMFVAVGVAGRRKMRAWVDLEGAQGFLRLVDRPYSGAAIFGLLSSIWIYGTLPVTVADIMLLAALIPVIRLAPVFVAPENRADLYGLLGLYAATRLAAIAPDGSVLRRATFLVVAIVAFAGLLRFVRHRLAEFVRAGGGWMRFVAFITRLAVVILAFAIGGGLFGWTQLSEMLTSAVLSSGYAAVILVLFASAAAGVGHVLPHTRLGDKLPSLRRHEGEVARVVSVAAQLVAFYVWIDAVLVWFQMQEPLYERLAQLASRPRTIGGLEYTLGMLGGAVLILIVTPFVSRLVRFFFTEEMRPRLQLPRGSAEGISTMLHYSILFVGGLLAAVAAGFNATQLTVVAGALGVGIGFGLQNIVNNFISGLILIFERPISVGDRIAVGQTQQVGIVTRIGIRASTVRTFDGSEVVVPNGDLISKEVTNWTLTDMRRRLELKINVAFGTDPHAVLEMLTKCAADHPIVLDDPAPLAVFDGYGESALMFRLLYWVPIEEILTVLSEVNLSVNDALKAAGVKIPYPQRDVHVHDDGKLHPTAGADSSAAGGAHGE